MKTTEIQATFVALLDTFEPITGQPTDEDLTRLKFACLSALVPIPFDRELGEHNLMGLLLSDDEYKIRNTNGVIFPSYDRPAIYDKTIATDASFGVRAKAEAIHKAKIEDWKTYDCARREVRNKKFYHCNGQGHVDPRATRPNYWVQQSGPTCNLGSSVGLVQRA